MTVGLDAETLEMMLETIGDFCADRLPAERLLELDHEDVCPEDVVREMSSDMGVQLPFIPEEYGGMGGGTMDVYRICEKMASIDLGVATTVFATFLGSDPIVFGATPDQKKKWISKIAEEAIIFAYGATEPEAGSDLGALKTKAVPVEQDGKIVGYRITGRKQWISNGGIADAWTILANAPGGPTWFVLGKGEDGNWVEGFSAARPEDKHGIRLSNTTALYLDNVYVDAEDCVGKVEGQGLIQAQLVFGYTRLMVAAFGLGGGWSALDRAIPYSVERVAGGAPLAEKQGYTHKLIVPHAIRLEAARSYIEEAAEKIDDGAPEGSCNTDGAIAKYLATEAGNAAAEAAIQAHGGYGYTREYMVEKIKRDVKITTIYEGTSEIMEMTIARDRWQQHLKTKGGFYHELGEQAEKLAAEHPATGAGTAALALHALADVLEWMRVGRLTRSQHVLFRIGELMAYAETAASFARRAARAAEGKSHAKTSRRFDAEALSTMSRVFAREAAMKVATEGIKLVRAGGGADNGQLANLEAAARMREIEAAQAGLLDDMDRVADVIYGRTA